MNAKEVEDLKNACKKLEIKNVLLSDSKSLIKDEFSTENYDSSQVGLQRFNAVIGHGYSEDTKEYVFKFSAGIRLIPKEKAREAIESKSEDFTLIEVKAKFNIIYHANEPLSEDEAKIFSEQTVCSMFGLIGANLFNRLACVWVRLIYKFRYYDIKTQTDSSEQLLSREIMNFY